MIFPDDFSFDGVSALVETRTVPAKRSKITIKIMSSLYFFIKFITDFPFGFNM